MKNTYLFQLLGSFSRQELRNFRKFIRSPYFNNRKAVSRYFDVVKNFLNESPTVLSAPRADKRVRETRAPTKEFLFQKMYPPAPAQSGKKKFSAGKIEQLSSMLLKLAKEFLALEQHRKDGRELKRDLLETLKERDADALFEKEFRAAEKNISANIDEKFFYWKSEFERLKAIYYNRRGREIESCQARIRRGEHLITNFLTSLLDCYTEAMEFELVYSYKFEQSTLLWFINNLNLQEYISKLSEESADYEHFFYSYYRFMAYTHFDNNEYYIKFKEYSFKNKNQLPPGYVAYRITALENYCVIKLEADDKYFLREIFELYKEELLIMPPEILYVNLFINFVIIGVALKEIDYIEKFISEKQSKLHGASRKETINRCYAELYIHKKQWDKALEHLLNIEHQTPLSDNRYRTLYIQIYYEKKQWDAVFSTIDAHRHYLNNDKTLGEKLKLRTKKFLKYTEKLAKLKSMDNRDGISKLKNEISNDIALLHWQSSYRWLIEKAEELEAKQICNS